MIDVNDNNTGTIIKGVGGLYTVRPDSSDGEAENILCRARGIFRYENLTPLVGDRVRTERDTEESRDNDGESSSYVISEILPRKNDLIRPAVANLSHLFIVIPAAKPKPDLITVDKLVSIAESRDIEPVIIVNKKDIDPEEAERIKDLYNKAGFTVILLSAATGEGCEFLLSYIESESSSRTVLAAFAGASAAGKSTLMKKIFPDLDLKTGEVSRKTERGRHTTRHAELFPVLGGRCFIADTPGFSLLDFTRFNFYGLKELPFTFREFADCLGKCRYTKCTHTKEEGCAVLEKLKDGKISKERHDSYLALFEEIKKKPEWKRKKEETEKNRQ